MNRRIMRFMLARYQLYPDRQTRSQHHIANGIDMPAFTLDMNSKTGAGGRQPNRQKTWTQW
jgi:hypothetical protein